MKSDYLPIFTFQMLFGVLTPGAQFLTMTVQQNRCYYSNRYATQQIKRRANQYRTSTYNYYMSAHARSQFAVRCNSIAPYIRNGKWMWFDDNAGNKHIMCFTTHGTVDFVARGKRIATVMTNANGFSLDKLAFRQIRLINNYPSTLDPKPNKPAAPRRGLRTNFSPRYLTD